MSFTDTMWAEIGRSTLRSWNCRSTASSPPARSRRERFLFYMIQDAHYLGAFARALATAAAKAETTEAQVKFAGSARDAILVERALHEGFFRDFGVSPEQFASTPPSPTCSGYCDFLQATAYRHPFAVAVAALLPCFQIYHEVGKRLHAIAAPANPYQRWIDTYQDEEFGRSVREVLALTDAAHGSASPAERLLMREGYLKATRYEWMFWDSAYRQESWPV